MKKMRVIGYEIHDLDAMTSYFVKESSVVANPIDKSLVEASEEQGTVITCGKTIVEPVREEI